MFGGVDWCIGLGDEAVDAGGSGVRALREDDAAGGVSFRDGRRCAVVGAVRGNRAILSEAGQWPAASRCRADAAHLFLAAVVQSVGPGGGGSALRFAGDAPLCRDRSRPRAGARRDDGDRSEEHTSELQSHVNLVCRLLLEKKKKKKRKEETNESRE